jgi:hypothetical protein
MRSKLILFSILAVVGLLGAAFVCGIFMPGKWHAEASGTVRAPPAAIYPWISEVKRWPEWFPWNTEKDPAITYAFSGPTAGVGAVLEWNSEKVGHGTLTITRSDPEKGIAYDLVLRGSPLPSHGEIALAPAADGTLVTWSDGGEVGSNPVARLFRGVVEQMLAQEFAISLARLERVVIAAPAGAPPTNGAATEPAAGKSAPASPETLAKPGVTPAPK